MRRLIVAFVAGAVSVVALAFGAVILDDWFAGKQTPFGQRRTGRR